MAGNTNFPTSLDDNTSLHDVTDSVTQVLAAHHNNTKEAVKAIEAKLGVFNSAVATSLDYRLGHPTLGHSHNASGAGARIAAGNLIGLASALADNDVKILRMQMHATAIVGSNVAPPLVIGRTMQLLSIQAGLRRGPSGATTAFDVMFGATSVYGASQGYRPIFPPGATAYRSAATPNCITYPSGAVITLDTDTVGSNEPGQDLGITFIFRD